MKKLKSIKISNHNKKYSHRMLSGESASLFLFCLNEINNSEKKKYIQGVPKVRSKSLSQYLLYNSSDLIAFCIV
jgi:hypothetical protein